LADKDGAVSGADAAKFFPASGLPSDALSRVWRGSCVNGVTLDLVTPGRPQNVANSNASAVDNMSIRSLS
jgi:hypothetical protein